MSTQFIRASFVPFLAGLRREKARQHVVAGTFGPRFQPKGRQRETLLRLDQVLAVLRLDDEAITTAVARYLADHKLARPPIVISDIRSLRQIGGGK